MNADERDLITGLFDRMRSQGSIEKDRDAEALIFKEVRAIPDSAYMLVQSVLVQEQALQQAGDRIQDLEARVQELEAAARPQAQASSGGFLGGLFGGGKPAQSASVPSSRSASPWGDAPQPPRQQQPASPWGNQAQAPMQQQAPQQSAGGGFMKSAMATAAGVAGGMLAANAIGNMLGGGHHNQGSQNAGYNDAAQDAAQDQEMAAAEPQYQDPSSNDQGNYSDTSDSGWGGGDGGGGDDA
ncbi:MAG: DUF2076 domain-containing protein [Hyphomicrobiaceae bacterium]